MPGYTLSVVRVLVMLKGRTSVKDMIKRGNKEVINEKKSYPLFSSASAYASPSSRRGSMPATWTTFFDNALAIL